MSLQTPDEPKKYTTVYTDFRGVDFTNDETNVWKRRTPTGLNIIPDEAGRPWKRTGWEIALSKEKFLEVINADGNSDYTEILIKSVHSVSIAGGDHLIIASDIGVFDYSDDTLSVITYDTIDLGRAFYFESGATEGFYFFSGETMYRYDGSACEQIKPYVPTVLISRSPSGGGTLLEAINLINSERKEMFLGDNTSLDYYVSSPISDEHAVVVEIANSNGIFEELESDQYEVIVDEQLIRFSNPMPPVAKGEDNVRITYPSSEKREASGAKSMKALTTMGVIDTAPRKYIEGTFKIDNHIIFKEGKPQLEVYAKKRTGKFKLEYNVDFEVRYTSAGYYAVDVKFLTNKYPEIHVDHYNRATFQCDYTYYELISNSNAIAFSKCKCSSIYGTGLINSVFMSASSEKGYGSRVWYSKVADPTYFPDINYLEAGSNDTEVMGLAKVGEYLGIIKQGDSADSTVYLAYPISFEESTAYAVKQSVNGIGAVSINCFNNLGDELLFLSKEGIMAVDAAASDNDKKVRNRSYYLNKKLLSEPNLETAVSFVWNRFYILGVNSHCYILDGTQKSSWANERTNLQYEGYYWENINALCFAQYNDSLWFADKDGNMCRMKKYEDEGILAYSDNGEPISCEWSTILDNDGATNFFKNLQKKGCLVTLLPMEKTGAEVYVRADGNEPEYIGEVEAENPNVPIEFFLNKKVKKYKRLQIIVKNDKLNQGFGLQEIIKVYTVGNYSK